MLKTLEEETWFYIFEHDDETDEYFLDVACGTVAIFTIKIRLNEKEVASYKNDPTSIRILAYDILDHPKDFLDRRV